MQRTLGSPLLYNFKNEVLSNMRLLADKQPLVADRYWTACDSAFVCAIGFTEV